MMASTGHSWEGNPVRLLPEPSIPTFLSPRVNPVQVRRLLRLGIILRWVAIAFAGLAGVLTEKPPPLLFYLMLTALIYNLAVMAAAGQASEATARRLALGTTVIDQFFNLGFIAIYAGALPSGDQVAPYVVGLIEAVAYFGIAGGVLSVAIFFAFFTVLDGGSAYLGHNAVSPAWLLGATLIIALIAVTLVPVMRILMAPADATELAPELRLSRREHDVLRLVAPQRPQPGRGRGRRLPPEADLGQSRRLESNWPAVRGWRRTGRPPTLPTCSIPSRTASDASSSSCSSSIASCAKPAPITAGWSTSRNAASALPCPGSTPSAGYRRRRDGSPCSQPPDTAISKWRPSFT